MKLDQDTTAGLMVLTFFIVGLFIVGAGAIWDNQQVRMMYQQAYAKNMDCRVATTQSGGSDFVNKVCGEIPQFGNYRND